MSMWKLLVFTSSWLCVLSRNSSTRMSSRGASKLLLQHSANANVFAPPLIPFSTGCLVAGAVFPNTNTTTTTTNTITDRARVWRFFYTTGIARGHIHSVGVSPVVHRLPSPSRVEVSKTFSSSCVFPYSGCYTAVAALLLSGAERKRTLFWSRPRHTTGSTKGVAEAHKKVPTSTAAVHSPHSEGGDVPSSSGFTLQLNPNNRPKSSLRSAPEVPPPTDKYLSSPNATVVLSSSVVGDVKHTPSIDATMENTSVEESEKPIVVFVLGGPGAGKGTQCSLISSQLGFKHISAGDCLREERESGSEYAETIEQYIREGRIVPVKITVALLKKKMEFYGWKTGKFLIDGFPRNQDNLDGWTEEMKNTVRIAFCLVFDCDDDVMLQRLMERGKASGRSDDNIETIRKRFVTFKNETMPIVKHFESLKMCRHANGTNPVDVVWKDVQEHFKDI